MARGVYGGNSGGGLDQGCIIMIISIILIIIGVIFLINKNYNVGVILLIIGIVFIGDMFYGFL